VNIFAEFFSPIYQHTPNADQAFIAWGDVRSPLWLSVPDLVSGEVANISRKQNTYFTPAVFQPGQKTIVKTGVLGSSVAWVDVDGYKFETHSPYYQRPLLPPTFVIKSGGDGGYHYYWVLSKFTPQLSIETINKALAKHLQITGEGCWNGNRVLRVPGTLNYGSERKGIYDPPRECELAEINPAAVYAAQDILKLDSYNFDILKDIINPEQPNGDRSIRDWKITHQLVKWGLSDDAIRIALRYHSQKVQDPKHGEGYLETTLANAKAKWIEEQGTKPTIAKKPTGPIANVLFRPVATLVSAEGAELGIVLNLEWNDKKVMAHAASENFASRSAVIKWLQQYAGTRTFFGKDMDALELWGALIESCPPKQQVVIPHAGRFSVNGTRFLVYNNQDALTYPVNDAVSVFLKPAIPIDIVGLQLRENTTLSSANIEQISTKLFSTQPSNVLLPALGWLFMTPFKALLAAHKISLPILLVYGFAGSGKTTFIQSVLLPLLGVPNNSVSSELTKWALIAQMGSTNGWPVWLSEFRSTNPNAADLMFLVRNLYDSGDISRGNADKSVDTYHMVAPLIVDGEEPFPDPATADRTVALRLDKTNIVGDTQWTQGLQAWQSLDPELFRQFAGVYMKWTLEVLPEEVLAEVEKQQQQMSRHLPDARTSRNAAICATGLVLANRFLSLCSTVQWPTGAPEILAAITNTYRPGLGAETYIDRFVEKIAVFHYLADLGTIWDEQSGTLWFNLIRAVHTLRERTPKDMLKIQLQERLSSYITGPQKLRGGADYWGIDIRKAQSLGLDIARPGAVEVALDAKGLPTMEVK
jgi:hypothetical protein